MKYSIAWHTECLNNRMEYWNEARKTAMERLSQCDRSALEIEFYMRQIEEAERSGLTEFDRDRFMVSRKQKKDTKE